MASFKLYGVPLSQPFRAVAWTLLQQKVPFTVKLIVPGATTSIGSRHESFLAKTVGQTGKVPILEILTDNADAPTWTISESPAILTFLCERQGDSSTLYAPPASRQKALIDSYMHWHHEGTRAAMTQLTVPFLRPDLPLSVTNQSRQSVGRTLSKLDQAWLKDTLFLTSNERPSIADLLAYEEIAQATMTGILEELTPDNYPRLYDWVSRMQELPFHTEAHAALKALGSLAEESEVPLAKRLGIATKAGLKALEDAQATNRLGPPTM
jgi:glutathione S-transferase